MRTLIAASFGVLVLIGVIAFGQPANGPYPQPGGGGGGGNSTNATIAVAGTNIVVTYVTNSSGITSTISVMDPMTISVLNVTNVVAMQNLTVTNAGVATIISSNTITTGTGIYSGGSSNLLQGTNRLAGVTLIDTNISGFVEVPHITNSLPFGVTNMTGGNALLYIQLLQTNALTGNSCATLSNSVTGRVITLSPNSIAAQWSTNTYGGFITASNTYWMIRDNGAGTHLILDMTNWFDR